MRQRARVKETDGEFATVEVTRSTMCDGCEKSGGCGGLRGGPRNPPRA